MVQGLSFKVSKSLAGERLDRAVTAHLEEKESEQSISRSQVSKLIGDGRVTINGKAIVKPGFRLEAGMNVEIAIPSVPDSRLESDTDISLEILFEDSEILVINKQAGLVVHPGAGNPNRTLVNALLSHVGELIREVGSPLRPGIVHRLDKDTTGALVVAKTAHAYAHLIKQFLPPRTIHRSYLAVTQSLPHESEGVIDLAIGRSSADRKKMVAHPLRGKPALTRWKIKERLKIGGVLQLDLETGRTHQIRAHLQALHCAILGDPLYSKEQRQIPAPLRVLVEQFKRQALHAWKLSLIHPSTEKQMVFEASLPEDLEKIN